MKTILYICTEATPGMIPFATYIVKAASKSEHLDVHAITVDSYNLSFQDLLKDLPQHKIHCLKTPESRFLKIRNKFYAVNILNKVKEIAKMYQIDVIHLLTVDYTCALILSQLKKTSRVYYTVHDVIPHEKAYTGIKDYLFAKYIRLCVKRIMRKAGCLVTNSKRQYRLMKANYPNKNIYFHLFPPLLTDIALSGDKTCPELTNMKNYVLFFGNIDIYKGVEYLYKAFKNNQNLQDYHLVIAGNGPLYFTLSHNPRILFVNRYIADDEMKSLFTKSSCVVFPYISATQSGVLSIAYQFQTPALVSDIPYFREVDDEKCCMFFKPADAQDLSNKLEQLLFNTDLDEMKAAQKSYFANNYSEKAIITSIENIY